MNISKFYPALQFSLFRIVLGIYLLIHFLTLFPYAAEVYSNVGMLPDAKANPTFAFFPSIFWINDGPEMAHIVVAIASLFSLSLMLGICRISSAIGLWYISACLFNRNILTNNPSLAYIGLILLLTALVPDSEPITLRKKKKQDWFMPGMVYWSAWILMAVGYTVSGLIKLQSPSWSDGTALIHLANNPLARPGFPRELLLKLPDICMHLLTWGALATEIFFLPLCFFRFGRLLAWSAMVGLHIGILLVVDFADLTAGMLLLHLFTLDPEWFRRKADGVKRVLFFDGECGFCNNSVQTILKFDRIGLYRFAPLQGMTAKELLPEYLRNKDNLDSLVLAEKIGDEVRIQTRSSAVFAILGNLGGLCLILSMLKYLPRKLCDWAYDFIARNRQLISSHIQCRIPNTQERERFLE